MKPGPEKSQAFKKQTSQNEASMKSQRLLMLQQIEHLKYEVEDYKRRDQETKKLNETVISSYKNNDHARDQIMQTSLQDLSKKHKEEIQRIVSCHAKNINSLEAEIRGLKEKLESSGEAAEQTRFEIERNVRIKLEDSMRKEKEELQNTIRDLKQKNSSLESKWRKAEHMLKTYREHVNKIDFESSKNQILKNTSVQYSWLSQVDKRRDEDDMMLSGMYRSKSRVDFQQSKMMRSHTNILSSADLKTLNHDRKYQNEKRYQIEKQNNRGVRSSRRMTKDFMDEVSESSRKSRKYLQINRESIQNLTSRISQAASSLQKMKKGIPNKRINDVINQKLERKLRVR